MRRAVALIFILALTTLALVMSGCESNNPQSEQRRSSIEDRAESFSRAEALLPIPRNENFPLRQVLVEYTVRQDLVNHPWYTYILNDLGAVTHYFVSTAVPVNSCAFLGSTEDIRDDKDGNLILTAPSLDGIYYGGSGAASACNGWIFVDAGTGVLGMAFGMKIMTFDAPLILETEPTLIQPIAVEP